MDLFPFGSVRATRLPLGSVGDDETLSPSVIGDHGWSRKTQAQSMKISGTAKWNYDDPALREALNRSLARVHTHTKNRSIGIISANQARYELSQTARKAGFGYAHMKAMRRDAVVSEPSLLIIGREDDRRSLRSFLIKHGRKYDQSCILYKSGNSENATSIYTRDDEGNDKKVGDEEDWGKWHANRTAARFFAALDGKRHSDFGEGVDEMQVVYTLPKVLLQPP